MSNGTDTTTVATSKGYIIYAPQHIGNPEKVLVAVYDFDEYCIRRYCITVDDEKYQKARKVNGAS